MLSLTKIHTHRGSLTMCQELACFGSIFSLFLVMNRSNARETLGGFSIVIGMFSDLFWLGLRRIRDFLA